MSKLIKQTLTEQQYMTQLGAMDAGVRQVAQQLMQAGANGLASAIVQLEQLRDLIELVQRQHAESMMMGCRPQDTATVP